MPSLDEMLAAIAADDDGQDTESYEDSTDSASKPNATIKDLRAAIKRLERASNTAAKERDELRAWKEQRLEEDNVNALNGAGLSPRQAEVFLKFYGAVTPENIAEFRRDVLGAAPPAAGETQVEESDAPPVFRPAGPGGTTLYGQEDKPLSRAEFEEMWVSDNAKARAAMAAGKVAFRTG
jgi:hypothetical protein